MSKRQKLNGIIDKGFNMSKWKNPKNGKYIPITCLLVQRLVDYWKFGNINN